MRWPFRRFLLSRVFATMERSLNPDRARNVTAVVDYRIRGRRDGGSDHYQVVIEDGGCDVTRRPTRSPQVTLELDGPDFLRLMTGNAGGPMLLLGGRLQVAGNLMLALRLPRLFRIPRPRPTPAAEEPR